MKNLDISEIKLDLKNANKHTQYGMSLLEKSLQTLGAGRSILLDKDNNVICGNGVTETNGTVGLPIKVIDIDGTSLIALRRTDLKITDKKARELAIADNAVANKNLDWDYDILVNDFSDIDLQAWGVEMPDNNSKSSYNLQIKCNDITEFEQLQSKLGINSKRIEYVQFCEVVGL